LVSRLTQPLSSSNRLMISRQRDFLDRLRVQLLHRFQSNRYGTSISAPGSNKSSTPPAFPNSSPRGLSYRPWRDTFR
jgi:hypothetical protein